MSDLQYLKAKFPHVGEETIKQAYAEAFRDIARGKLSLRTYRYSLARYSANDRLQREHPAEAKLPDNITIRKESKATIINNAFFRFFEQAFGKAAEPAETD